MSIELLDFVTLPKPNVTEVLIFRGMDREELSDALSAALMHGGIWTNDEGAMIRLASLLHVYKERYMHRKPKPVS